jgi:diadenosine tetraphosphate (Ap4A) HIT family hydrolase
MEFILDSAFEAGAVPVGDLALCHVRLQADLRWPWLILIPRVARLRELEDMDRAQRAQLLDEAVAAGEAVRAIGEAAGFGVEKLNIGALGNLTPQFHLHIVGRRQADPAWPGPVWGAGPAIPYGQDDLTAALAAGRRALGV